MDAFGTAHRAQASTHGVIRFAPVAAGGPLLMAELDALAKALAHPARPLLAIVAGSKVSTKLELLSSLVDKVDQLIVGGGIANTFIAAAGYKVGKSLCEPDLIETANRIVAAAKARGAEIPLPSDVVVAKQFNAEAEATVKAVDAVAEDDLILDIGPDTAARYAALIGQAGTVVWNGPVGVFEFDAFSHGTETLARAIAAAPGFSIAGGGDTLAGGGQVRHCRPSRLHLHRRWRLPRVPRRQDPAGRGRPGSPRPVSARPSTLFFDMDGTLIDSEPGIVGGIVHTFERLGQLLPSMDQLRGWIGPPCATVSASALAATR